jgi:hypothetical protein
MSNLDIYIDQPVKQGVELVEVLEEMLDHPLHFVLSFATFAVFMAFLIFTFAAIGEF